MIKRMISEMMTGPCAPVWIEDFLNCIWSVGRVFKDFFGRFPSG